ncbi:barstar family protein [Streptomyces sp. NPDC006012]|uniref:barstar family protein n=1 Tax=Streptomyces sp. NPDC006012 TaxID=3364739 RepID=UPI003698F35C
MEAKGSESSGGSENLPFRLVDQQSQTVLLRAEDILGFFVDPDQTPPDLVTFTGVQHLGTGRGKTEEAELQVVDRHGERIGAYYLGRVRAARSRTPDVNDERNPEVPYDFFGFTEEFPEAGRIWKRWAGAGPVESGEWARVPAGWQESWLHVVQTSWFTTGRRATRYRGGGTVELDGSLITGRDAFYCALGEAANGPRGYFGSNLDALFDCLRTARADGTAPFELVWREQAASRAALGADFTGQVLGLLGECGVTVRSD